MASNQVLAELEAQYCKAVDRFRSLHPPPPWARSRRIMKKTFDREAQSKVNRRLRWKNFVKARWSEVKSFRALADAWNAMGEEEKDSWKLVVGPRTGGDDYRLSQELARLCEVSLSASATPWGLGDKSGPINLRALESVSPQVNTWHDAWVKLTGEQTGTTALDLATVRVPAVPCNLL